MSRDAESKWLFSLIQFATMDDDIQLPSGAENEGCESADYFFSSTLTAFLVSAANDLCLKQHRAYFQTWLQVGLRVFLLCLSRFGPSLEFVSTNRPSFLKALIQKYFWQPAPWEISERVRDALSPVEAHVMDLFAATTLPCVCGPSDHEHWVHVPDNDDPSSIFTTPYRVCDVLYSPA